MSLQTTRILVVWLIYMIGGGFVCSLRKEKSLSKRISKQTPTICWNIFHSIRILFLVQNVYSAGVGS